MLIREIFYNEENGFGVFMMQVKESSEALDKKEVTIVGHFMRPHPDELLLCHGKWIEHPRFGRQFEVVHLQKEMPSGQQAIVKYLSSDMFHGVGLKTAEKIVHHLGENALEKIVDNPDVLVDIPGISSEKAHSIATGLQGHRSLENALVFLYRYGIGPILAMKIVQTYKEHTVDLVRAHPYRLIEDIEGIGFHKADELAQQVGVAVDSPQRFQAAVLFSISEAAMAEGHVFLTQTQLEDRVRALILRDFDTTFPEELREQLVQGLVMEGKLLEEEGRLYLPSLYYAEYGMAAKVQQLLNQTEEEFPVHEPYEILGQVEESLSVSYADKQREAMLASIQSPLMILTGGPGTGKTTVIRGICHLFAQLHEFSLDPKDYEGKEEPYPIRLAAPTGRAAKRMSESTGLPAMTIHRLLGWRGEFFERDSEHPIEGSLLIVDEVSMMDMWLANQLFRAIPKGMQVLLVGDADQLPSVGPGKVLHHLLDVEQIPRVELTDIFRQKEGSSIIQLAHAMKEGELPDDLLQPLPDRRFFSTTREQTLPVVLKTYEEALHRGYTLFDVQVLAPMYKGEVGVNRINEEIQASINPPHPGKKEVKWGEGTFRLHDKVLQLVNHPEYPVYNGDMGQVIALNEDAVQEDPVLWVNYDRQEVAYKRSQLNQLSLAYACSIHKAQGSEFPIVIMPVLSAYRRMLKRNLLYTGVTRSQSYLILCGEMKAMRSGIRVADGQERNSFLANLIREWL
ncbi:ATP-dependent RecD-like DNA helicase [Mechercharimyces sp. CAU 1602]|uniref:SF1B family DNA helicase RecD2 n=1 Tax=Mechercharimyces sp. CAU 1602 TaxID=2973933 RepID=UPI002161E5DA|nr:ATP-dependent RecD-like DNA helicase [Mechercharimyces sp. CAU 1602]MCS1350255.1 ATP-dependent RecD-like DNA helicase [Mechercharimyces sp. CAU 1602]